MKIPTLTIYQPYAQLIAVGAKRYETRSRPWKYRGKIAIHAGAKLIHNWLDDRELARQSRRALGAPSPAIDWEFFNGLPHSAIIATADMTDCWKIDNVCGYAEMFSMATPKWEHVKGDELLFGDYKPGRYAYELQNVKILPEPIPAKGRQGIWYWEDET